ncbi:hypothetical protein [Sphingomonas cavernae]|uniref:Tetratricopeptide repeat protein n=1 Tax=Sphingomonas cavernae TaxID=2320861 RepID=A0A418W6U8_9SPHN|nr:hypothetical protein [Sphingomonas cavernae]RJF85742.1 hypothetical protein D3876_17815 [Sphingomonas cavernae]
MKTALLLAGVAAVAASAAPNPPASIAQTINPAMPAANAAPAAPAPVRLPGFAAALAQQPEAAMPSVWRVIPDEAAWKLLSKAKGVHRQRARWNYVRSLVGRGRGPEAWGVLEVMQQDDPDLMMVDAFRLARGAALTLMGRPADGFAELSGPGLVNNAEACAWRVLTLAQTGFGEQAMAHVNCALPAINARKGADRRRFIIGMARAAVETGKPELASRWLAQLPDRDSAANLYRGRVSLALGQPAEARLRFARVEQSGTMAERMDARLSQIEAKVANGSIRPAAALKELDKLRYVWRGDHIEERALQLSYRMSAEAGDLRGALGAGATLFRFFEPGRQGPDFVAGLQARLSAALDPASKLPLDQAAGLYWDYRDLAPSGAAGDFLVNQLAERLQIAGLYGRAADLLEHQLFVRARDLAQGPLSARVASLHILAGRPDRALSALRKTAGNAYPDDMINARKRVEAVALSQIGKVEEAFAVLQDVPGASVLRAEILWKNRDWAGLAIESEAQLPAANGRISDVDQAVVLRYAISLAMLGREDALADMRVRYGASFAGLSTAPVFDMLTAAVGTVDPAAVTRAMTSIPSVSPAGDLAELIEAGPEAAPPKRG